MVVVASGVASRERDAIHNHSAAAKMATTPTRRMERQSLMLTRDQVDDLAEVFKTVTTHFFHLDRRLAKNNREIEADNWLTSTSFDLRALCRMR